MTGHGSAPAPAPPAPTGEPTLKDYGNFLRRHRLLLTIGLSVGLTAGLFLHYSQPLRYTSTAHVVIVATSLSANDGGSSDVSIDSALQLLRSDQVVGYAAREVGYPGGPTQLNADLTARPIVHSRIVRLSVSAPQPALAERAVTITLDRFLDVRGDGLVRTTNARSAAVAAELEVVEAELDRRYGQGTPDEDEEQLAEENQLELAGMADLVTLRAQLHGELAALSISEPNPGYLSRPPTEPSGGFRSGLAITLSSTSTMGLLAAVGIGVWRRPTEVHIQSDPSHRGDPFHGDQ